MSIPTISLTSPSAAIEIAKACEHVGFFQIVDHGVDRQIVERAWETAGQFFDRPLPERLAVAMPYPGYPYGYQGLEAERLAFSLGNDTPPDRKHTFSIGPIDPATHDVVDPDEKWVRSPNQWPADAPEFRVAAENYYYAMGQLCARILGLMAVGLQLPADFFEPSINEHTSALRLLDYPHAVTAPAPGQLRAGAHTDYGTLTILRQDDAPGGLEVRSTDGQWIAVPAIESAFVVNVGDCLGRWTNDRWRSTLHRVVNPPIDAKGSTRRRSIAFFHNANWDATISCLATCTRPGEGPRYEPVLAGQHLMSKFIATVT